MNTVRKIVVSELMTIDGVIQDPQLWMFDYSTERSQQYKLDELKAADSLLLGRVTYDGFASAWPTMADEAGFADRMNGYPKYVVSNTLTDASWSNSTVISHDVVKSIAGLKEQSGRDILVYGSGDLIQTLTQHDLIDEYRLMIFPLVLGEGQRLFGDAIDVKKLQLIGTETFDKGVILLTYAPAEATSAEPEVTAEESKETLAR